MNGELMFKYINYTSNCCFCGKSRAENQCSKCKVRYCNKECQKADYSFHKTLCISIYNYKKGGDCTVCWEYAEKLKICGKCNIARYCSKECQLEHWPKHKNWCKIPEEIPNFADQKVLSKINYLMLLQFIINKII